MSLTARSGLAEVAACVARALARSKIRAVLTGGACATLYSRGEYQSSGRGQRRRSAVQLTTSVIGSPLACSISVSIRKRLPSEAAS